MDMRAARAWLKLFLVFFSEVMVARQRPVQTQFTMSVMQGA